MITLEALQDKLAVADDLTLPMRDSIFGLPSWSGQGWKSNAEVLESNEEVTVEGIAGRVGRNPPDSGGPQGQSRQWLARIRRVQVWPW